MALQDLSMNNTLRTTALLTFPRGSELVANLLILFGGPLVVQLGLVRHGVDPLLPVESMFVLTKGWIELFIRNEKVLSPDSDISRNKYFHSFEFL